MTKIKNILDLLAQMAQVMNTISLWEQEKADWITEASAVGFPPHMISEIIQLCNISIDAKFMEYKALQKEHAEAVRAFEVRNYPPIDFTTNKAPYFLHSAHNSMVDADRAADHSSSNYAA